MEKAHRHNNDSVRLNLYYRTYTVTVYAER